VDCGDPEGEESVPGIGEAGGTEELMEVLGPNPDSTMRFMTDLFQKRSAEVEQAATGEEFRKLAQLRLRVGERSLNGVYDVLTGRINTGSQSSWANFHSGARNIVTSAFLGSSMFSAIADAAFGLTTSLFNGIPPMRVLGRHLTMMNPLASRDRALAVRTGFGAQGWASIAIGQERIMGEMLGPAWTRRVADTTLRLSWLSPWTETGRWSWGLEALGYVTDNAHLRFDGLNNAFRNALEMHGIGAKEWDIIRSTKAFVDEESGAKLIRPQDMVRMGGEAKDVGIKLHEWILTEGEFAVPTTTPYVRALTTGTLEAGSFWGQIIRDAMLFKSFPLTMVNTHLLRLAAMDNKGTAAAMFAQLFISTAVMGVLGEQMSQIAMGRDPVTMDYEDPAGRKLLMKGLLRGGGIGIFGDFLFADQNRYGGGILETLAGPIFGTTTPDFFRVTVGNLQKMVGDEKTNFSPEMIRFAHQLFPGRSLWYARLAFERWVVDNLQRMADPQAERRFARMERRIRRETGQEYFSPPGSRFPPRRGPRLSEAIAR